jgi:rare lipoprotein A
LEQDKAAIAPGFLSLPAGTGFSLVFFLILSLVLAGCGSNPPAPMQDVARADAGKRPAGNAQASAARSGRGAYYKDDGPADDIPPGLENTPDAEPKIEALLPRANRPYVVFGKSYTPMAEDQAYRVRGVGSWYGRRYHGQRTSSGEPYDMFAMTAAHPTLPIPSYARVTHLASGRQVIVRINDRGPFLSERIIDLSYTAALKLGYLNHGRGELEVERLMPDEIARMAARRTNPQSESTLATTAGPAMTYPVASANVVTTVDSTTSVNAVAASTPVPSADGKLAAASGWYLQLGAYSQQLNAEQARLKVAANLPDLEVVQTGGLYRLYAGPWASRAQAEAALESARGANGMSAIVVQR